MSDDFLSEGASNPAIKFDAVGDVHGGVVTAVRKREDTSPDGTVKKWPNGDPMHVWVFDLDTDDGARSLWVRGQMVTAVREAAKEAGVATLVGAKLTVKHTGLGEPKQKGFSAPKLFKAKVEPAPPKPVDDFEPF